MDLLHIKDSTLTDMLQAFESEIFKKLEVSLPAEIVNVTNRNSIDVKPLIKIQGYDNNYTSRAIIKDVPIITYGGSSSGLTVPLKKGDKGVLIASDRDITLYKKSLSDSEAQTNRKHSFNDSFFIPNYAKEVKYPLDDSIYLFGGDECYLKINDKEILIKNGRSEILITGNQIKFDADSININGSIFTKDGAIKAKSIESDSVKVKGVEVAEHTHTGTGYQGTPLAINGMGK